MFSKKEELLDENVEEKVAEVFYAVVKPIKLNVREEPNLDSEIIITVNRGDVVKTIDDPEYLDWLRVTYESKEGYCMKKFLERIDDEREYTDID